jgi:putative transposase
MSVTEMGTGAGDGKAPAPPARLAAAIPDDLIDGLMAKVQAEGLELLGENGVLAELTKTLLERALDEQLTDHLGYERGDPAGRGTGNSRNGTTPKRVLTEIGAVELDVPRDRNGTSIRASLWYCSWEGPQEDHHRPATHLHRPQRGGRR